MAFVLEISYTTHQHTLANIIVSILRRFGLNAAVRHENGTIECSMQDDHPALQEALNTIGELLPASIYLRGSSHRFDERRPSSPPEFLDSLPLSVGMCPQCQKEMFDPSSRRYYYPFTSCRHCGGQYALFERYPYVRENTQLRFFQPCEQCLEELSHNPFRIDYPQISCHECGVTVSLYDAGMLRHANDKESFKFLFETAAKAIEKGNRVCVKTLMGERTFYRCAPLSPASVVMAVDASAMMRLFSLIDEEFHALLSIERPVLHVAVREKALADILGETVDLRYPDEGFSMLLGRELLNLGIDAVVYENGNRNADVIIDFDLEVQTQSAMRLFVNKEIRFVAQGERGSFPAYVEPAADVAAFARGFVAVREGERMIVDRPEHFSQTRTSKVNALEGEEISFAHSNIHRFDQDTASCMAVLSENRLRGKSAVCAYFDETISFLYTKGEHVTRVIPSEPFTPANLLERIGSLREGSDRLIENVRTRHPSLYQTLQTIKNSPCDLFEAAAMIIGLENPGMNALMKESLRFVGKGGLQIDMKLKDNRFDNVAFLASIISYKIADVPTSLLCYSVFESLGDYFSDILTELKNRSKAEHIVLCGSGFANQSLYSRMARNLKNTPPVLSRSFPIGRENAVIGGIYL